MEEKQRFEKINEDNVLNPNVNKMVADKDTEDATFKNTISNFNTKV